MRELKHKLSKVLSELKASHPLGVRELKQKQIDLLLVFSRSHPLGVRELKQGDTAPPRCFRGQSHPLGVRELKHLIDLVCELLGSRRTL